MTSEELREKFLKYFEDREHTIIPSASLIPKDDSSSLFIVAGMQPLTPYLLGERHPLGTRLVNSQKCVRTNDIDDVGDNTHLTFFEMLGIWSLGNYFKGQSIKQSYEFITSKEGLNLDSSRLYVSLFAGDPDLAPRDDKSFELWKSVGIPEEKIYFLGAEDNWWSAGDNGPCGPDTEIFYDVTSEGFGNLSQKEAEKAMDNQELVEIWNNVFMEYLKKDGKVVGKLEKQNVDTGVGFERLLAVLQGVSSVYETDLFKDILGQAEILSLDKKSARIIADHFRTAVFMISDGVIPSNTDRGYILRRLLRRAVMRSDSKKIEKGNIKALVDSVVDKYGDIYTNLKAKKPEIISTIEGEINKFEKTIEKGLREFNKMKADGIDGREAFILFSTYGFPLELTQELAQSSKTEVDVKAFEEEMKKHQETSKTAAQGMFKGGLADHSDMSLKYHTATHLLLTGLREVLGESVEQRGSNINDQRLRLDFMHPEKMTDEEKQKVEDWVNDKIEKNYPVSWSEMSVKEAKEKGAIGIFDEKYGDKVKVYQIGGTSPEDEAQTDADLTRTNAEKEIISMEICGGPHVESTGILGKFKIKKEESVSAGVRRIKAILE